MSSFSSSSSSSSSRGFNYNGKKNIVKVTELEDSWQIVKNVRLYNIVNILVEEMLRLNLEKFAS